VVWLALVVSIPALEGSRTAQPGARGVVSVACSNAVEAWLNDIRADAQRRLDLDVLISCELAASIAERIRGGGPFDLVILPPALVDELAAAGRVAPASRTMLGRSPVALAQKAGLPTRSTRTVDELRAVLMASPSIAFAKQGVSGVFFTNLLRQWNAMDGFSGKLHPMAAGPAVSASVARGDADLGVLPVSEIVSVPGLAVAAVFPPALDGYVVMEAAAATEKAETPHVRAFMRFLASADAIASLKRHGFETARKP
jgi:molybdate transport system substrate-binding protein